MTDPGNIEKKDKDDKLKLLTSMFLVLSLLVVCLTFASTIMIGEHTQESPVQKPSSVIVAGGEEEAAVPIQFGGRVVHPDGTPIANTRLQLHSVVQETTSDEHGWFFFKNVQPVRHELFAVDDQDQVIASFIMDLRLEKQKNSFEVNDMEDGRVNIALSSDIFYIEMDVTLDQETGSFQITPAQCYAASRGGLVYTRDGTLDVKQGITILPSGTIINQQSEIVHYPIVVQSDNAVIQIPREGIKLSDGTVVTEAEIRLPDGTSVTPGKHAAQTALQSNLSASSGSTVTDEKPGDDAEKPAPLNQPRPAAEAPEESLEEEGDIAPENKPPSERDAMEDGGDKNDSSYSPGEDSNSGGGSNNGSNGSNNQNNNESNNNESNNNESSNNESSDQETSDDETSSSNPTGEESSESSGNDPSSPEEPLDLSVSGEDRTGTWKTWVTNEQIDLFYHQNDGISTEEIPVIRPGSSGGYSFDLVNNGKGSISVTVRMTEDTIHLPFRFRLFQVWEGSETLITDWTTPMTRGHSVVLLEGETLPPDTRASYRMEWEWPYETGIPGDDENDTAVASKETIAERTYFLNMNVYAEGI